MEGDNKLVNLVEKWESIEEHTRLLESHAKVGSYQLKNLRDGVEVKVRVGQFGFVKFFKDKDDPELIQIEAFCKVEGFHKILGARTTEYFYL
jgi:hypothetical protein